MLVISEIPACTPCIPAYALVFQEALGEVLDERNWAVYAGNMLAAALMPSSDSNCSFLSYAYNDYYATNAAQVSRVALQALLVPLHTHTHNANGQVEL